MITLSNDTATLTLHPDLLWVDEFDWHPVEQRHTRTITGALIVSAASRIAGRPITLAPENDQSAWMTRGTLTSLTAMAAAPEGDLTLTLHGLARQVRFRHIDTAIEARPVVHYNDTLHGDWYLVTVRLFEV